MISGEWKFVLNSTCPPDRFAIKKVLTCWRKVIIVLLRREVLSWRFLTHERLFNNSSYFLKQSTVLYP